MGIRGLCGEETSQKQADFRAIISHHIKVCNNIFKKKKYGFPYIYIDAFGGPGYINDVNYTGFGSPVIAQESIKKYLNFDYQCFIYEYNQANYNRLIEYFNKEDVRHNSCSDLLIRKLPIKHEWQYGILYCDPDMTEKNFWLSSRIMKSISTRYKTIDLMFYVGCTAIKRMRSKYNKNISLSSLIEPIDKEWVIRELRGKHGQQYTFLVGANWTGWATWKNRGFHKVNSPQGQKIFNQANGEIKKKKYHQTSFLTGLIENTSIIPSIKLSERKRFSGLKAIVNFVKRGK